MTSRWSFRLFPVAESAVLLHSLDMWHLSRVHFFGKRNLSAVCSLADGLGSADLIATVFILGEVLHNILVDEGTLANGKGQNVLPLSSASPGHLAVRTDFILARKQAFSGCFLAGARLVFPMRQVFLLGWRACDL